MDRLLLGDASPSEVGRELRLLSNLLAHHVKLLDQAGLVERSRSEGDARRTYLRLRTAALSGLVSSGVRRASRVVFVCSRNSARSQLAAALWAAHSEVPAASAGTRPAERVHPLAVASAQLAGSAEVEEHRSGLSVEDVSAFEDVELVAGRGAACGLPVVSAVVASAALCSGVVAAFGVGLCPVRRPSGWCGGIRGLVGLRCGQTRGL